MPIYSLNKEIGFPKPELAEKSGLLAVGGDLSTERLILAYSQGIFPWYSDDDPILWWSPDPRMVLFPDKFKVTKSFKQVLNNKNYKVTYDTNFHEVIKSCSTVPRNDEPGTWITAEMLNAYITLHQEGFAHSVEVWEDTELIGGLYGVSLGRAFFGESMFFLKRDASKIALFFLVEKLKSWDFHFIDAQVETAHMKSLGAINLTRGEFLNKLTEALQWPTKRGKW